MSEISKLSSRKIKGWLERETGSVFVPIHARAEKLNDEMKKALQNLQDVSKMLLDNSGKEIEKRNMKTYRRARALNKLARLFVDRIHQIKVSANVSYDSFSKFVQECQRAFAVTDIDVRNWFPRISPFFILDRRKFLAVFEKSKETLKELQNFLAKEYVKTKTVEETFQSIERLQAFEQQLADLTNQGVKTATQKTLVEQETAEIRQKMVDLKRSGGLSQLDQTGAEMEALSVEVKHRLQHLQKPFVKLQSLATHGEGSGLTPEEVKKLDEYVQNPFEAFSTEQAGYPILKQILQKLSRSISEGKLKLKPEKVRKATQATEEIVNKNSLTSLHQKCTDLMARKTQLSVSAEVAATQQNLAGLQEQLENMKRKLAAVEAEESSSQKNRSEMAERIRNLKAEIEQNVFTCTGKKVQIG